MDAACGGDYFLKGFKGIFRLALARSPRMTNQKSK